ncbi:MAG: hypothetical protein MI923_27930 [Phycisphaerales bacterium]|nr:hypothetical protein [Phycisphaerales bacterium]
MRDNSRRMRNFSQLRRFAISFEQQTSIGRSRSGVFRSFLRRYRHRVGFRKKLQASPPISVRTNFWHMHCRTNDGAVIFCHSVAAADEGVRVA